MNRAPRKSSKTPEVTRDLEQYRQLVSLQKQMIELAEQYEQTKRECDDLRAEMRKRPAIIVPLKRSTLRPPAKKTVESRPKRAIEKVGLKLIIGGAMASAAQAVKTMGLK